MSTILSEANFTAVTLKTVAIKLTIPGRSKMNKDELRQAIISSPQGRKELYMLLDAQEAQETIAKILATGKMHSLMRPVEPAAPVIPNGSFNSLQALGQASGARSDKAFIAWKYDMDKFNNKRRALKLAIVEGKLSHLIQWNDVPNSHFHLAYVGPKIQPALPSKVA